MKLLQFERSARRSGERVGHTMRRYRTSHESGIAAPAELERVKQWADLASKELKGRAADILILQTPEGIPVKPLYTAHDLDDLAHIDKMPGFCLTAALAARRVRSSRKWRPWAA